MANVGPPCPRENHRVALRCTSSVWRPLRTGGAGANQKGGSESQWKKGGQSCLQSFFDVFWPCIIQTYSKM